MTNLNWHMLGAEHPVWLLIAIFLTAFAESLAFVGLVVPGVVMLVVLGGAAQFAGISLWSLLAVGFLGALIGDVLSYYWGTQRRDGIWEAPYLRRYHPWLLRGADFFQRWGWASIFVGRFVGPVRPVVPVVAGVLGMPARQFWLVDLLACLCWAPVYLLPGYWAGQLVRFLPSFPRPLMALGLCWALTLALLLFLLTDQRRLWRQNCVSLALALGFCVLMIGSIGQWWPISGVHAALSGSRLASLDQFALFVTHCGDVGVLATFALVVSVILAWRFSGTMALQWLCQLALGLVIFWGLKWLLKVPRPEGVLLLDPAFPSGHTWLAVLTWSGLALWLPWPQGRVRQIVLVLGGIFAVSIAYSRLYLGVHWWPDVFAGIMGALLQSILAARYVNWRYVVRSDRERLAHRPGVAPIVSPHLDEPQGNHERELGDKTNNVLFGSSARNLALLLGLAWCLVVAARSAVGLLESL